MTRKTRILVITIAFGLFLGIGTMVFTLVGAYKATHLPRQQILKNPADYGLNYQDIEFSSSDGINLKGWWIPNQSKTTIIITHGYGANRAGWSGKDKQGRDEYIDWIAGAVPLYQAGFSLFFFDFRACGESEGDTITLGYLEEKDLAGAIQWVLKNRDGSTKNPTENIGLLGYSMGGNVALRGGVILKKMVETNQIQSAAVVAVGPTIYNTMVKKSFQYWAGMPVPPFIAPMFKKSKSLLLGFNVGEEINPTRYVSEISPIPVMYIQAGKDEIGDVSDVKAMFNATGDPKELIIIPDALRFDHYKYPAQHPRRVVGFFSKHLI